MEQKLSIEQFKGQTRLPKFAIPKSYNLYLKPDLSLCSFSGSVRISLSITEPTSFIVLNALDLNIHDAFFTDSHSTQFRPCDVVLDSDDEILVLVFSELLGVGDGLVGIEFSGMLNEQLKGFYRCAYINGDEKNNMAVTQFEPVDARRCFPCWDEPALKATFKLTVDVPSELTALSNMPIMDEKLDGNVKTVYFEESPFMSTYLVAVVIGLFDYIENTTAEGVMVRVYCPLGKSDKGTYALSLAVKAIELYAEYFSMPYPLPKLDMVAVPEFSGGAMENYGLIIYRENELLYDESLSTAYRKQMVAIVLMHEVAHQWFGNLVSYMATDRLFPEWKIWTQFLLQTASGLRIDALEGSHPIEVEIHHARSVIEIFDAISYKKGSAVIRMLEGYLGDHIIQKSLSSYMKKYAWRNTKTEDLWSVLSEESHIPVNSMMDNWTKQKGHPVISVTSKDHFLEFEQSQFLSSGLHGDGKWTVPITFFVGSYDKCKNVLLESKVETVDISDMFSSSNANSSTVNECNEDQCVGNFLVKVNIEQSGFYRVKYEDKLAAQLRKAVENHCLSEMDKFGILDDTYALCEACEIPLSSVLSLMNAYREEVDFVVLSKLIDVCYNVVEISIDAIPHAINDLKEFFVNLLLFSAEKLGWDSVPGESHSSALSRREVYTILATLGHQKTHDEALQRFQALLNDRNTRVLSADTKRAAYIAVMRNASTTDRNGFDTMLKIYRETDAIQEKEQILRCIASCPDPEIVEEALNFLISDEVRDQDIIYGLVGISLEGRNMAWRWLKEKWDLIMDKYGAGVLLSHFVRDIITPLCNNEKAEEVEEFFRSRVNPSIAYNLKQSVE